MLRLEKRPDPSKTWGYLAPVLAVIATMIGGGVMFALLGKDPFEAIRTIFYDPLFSEFAWYYRPQLLIKGAPLILIAIGLSMGFRAGNLEHWSGRSIYYRCHLRRRCGPCGLSFGECFGFSSHDPLRCHRWFRLGHDPRNSKNKIWH